MRRLAAMLGAAVGLVGTARAAEEPVVPEVDFLEYLGSWQAEDEEWVVEAGWEAAEEDEDVAPPQDSKQEPEAESEGTE